MGDPFLPGPKNVKGARCGLATSFFLRSRAACIYSRLVDSSSDRPPVALRAVALFEAAKGLLAWAAAAGLLSLRHTDLHAATDAFLRRHGFDPEQHYTRLFIESVARATHHHSGQIVCLALVYGVIRLAEAYGLWNARHWAEWFAVLSAGLYLPLELEHFTHRPGLLNAGIIAFNLALIFYLGKLLFQQRERRRAARVQLPPVAVP